MTNEQAKEFGAFYDQFKKDRDKLLEERPRCYNKDRRILVKIPPTFTIGQRISFWDLWKNQAVMLPADTWLQRKAYSYLRIEQARKCIPYNEMAVDLETSNRWLFIFWPLNHYKQYRFFLRRHNNGPDNNTRQWR